MEMDVSNYLAWQSTYCLTLGGSQFTGGKNRGRMDHQAREKMEDNHAFCDYIPRRTASPTSNDECETVCGKCTNDSVILPAKPSGQQKLSSHK